MAIYCYGKGAICNVPCTNKACEHYNDEGGRDVTTVVDKIRSMSDDELVTAIENLLTKLFEARDNTLVEKICDGQGDCDKDGNCTSQRHRACIMRFLHQPAEILEDGT